MVSPFIVLTVVRNMPSTLKETKRLSSKLARLKSVLFQSLK